MAYRTQKTLKTLALAGTAMALIAYGPAAAQAAKKIEFDIEAQELGDALNEFGVQSGKEVYYLEADIAGKQSKGVEGVYSAGEAINLLLNSTGIPHTDNGSGTILIGEAYIQRASLGEGTPEARSFRVASLAQENDISRIDDSDEDDVDAVDSRDTIVVTGSLIRGIAPESSPTRTFDREDIQISGAATAQEFIRTLPQNFGGGSSDRLAGGLPNDIDSGRNVSLGSSVNLRGLGSNSTLVLLNGRRLAPSSAVGNVTDISVIPASAIDRVEVLTDGASSIYGSDAVAGVTNFVLRDDFQGIETSFRYGLATQNRSAEEFRGAATGGLNWDSGNALVSYEYFNQDEIGVQDRSFSQNVLPPVDLQPSQKRHSALATISQDIGSNLEIFADVTFSRRESHREFRNALVGDIIVQEPTSENLSVATGGSWKISDTWFLDFSGAYGESSIRTRTTRPTSFSSNEYTSDLWTGDVKMSGTVLTLPGGDLKLAFGGQFRSESFARDDVVANTVITEGGREVYAAFGEAFIPIIGPDNAIPGVNRFELNVSGRFDDYSDFGSTANPKVGVLWSPVEGVRFRGSYGTSFNPPAIGLRRETFGLAYNSSFFFPLLGITPADPSLENIVVLAPGGNSRNLGPETSRAFTAGVDFDRSWDEHKIAFSGTWFDIDFDGRLGTTPIPGGGGTQFDVPNVAFTNPGAFPEGTVIFSPSLDQISAVLADIDLLSANSPPFFGDPFDASIIELTQLNRNLSRSIVSGLDLSASYTYDSGIGVLNLGFDATYLLEFKQQAASTSPIVDLVNTQFNPVDLKLRARAGYSREGFAANLFVNYVDDYQVSEAIDDRIDSWTTVDLNLSYDTQGRTRNSLISDTVFRFSVINVFDEDPPLAPENSGFVITGYDPTNASPLGRFISFEISKRF